MKRMTKIKRYEMILNLDDFHRLGFSKTDDGNLKIKIDSIIESVSFVINRTAVNNFIAIIKKWML